MSGMNGDGDAVANPVGPSAKNIKDGDADAGITL